MEDYDHNYYKNLKWMIDNDATILERVFTETYDYFGKDVVEELIPNGKNIKVDNENKHQFVQEVSFFKLYKNVKAQIDAFLQGFYSIVPRKYISIFDHKELELIISGLPEIDIDDLKSNTEYKGGWNQNHEVVKWFWEVLYTLNSTEKAEFL